MNREYFDFCMDRHRDELARVESIYTRAGVLLGVTPLLMGAAYAMSTIERMDRLFSRIDVFAYYLASAASVACIAIVVVYAFKCLMPPVYPVIAPIWKWDNARKELRRRAMEQNTDAGACEREAQQQLDQMLIDTIIEDEKAIRELNIQRLTAFGSAMWWTRSAVISLAAQGVLHCLVTILERQHA